MYFGITISGLQHVSVSLFFYLRIERVQSSDSCLFDSWGSFLGSEGATAYCLPPLDAKLRGTVHPLPIVFLACCLIKHKEYLTVILLLVFIL
jgi:hypothetical protein